MGRRTAAGEMSQPTDVSERADTDPSARSEPSEQRSNQQRDPQSQLVGALVAGVFGALGWFAAAQSAVAVLVVVAVVQAVLVISWTMGMQVPGRWGAATVALLVAAAGDVLVARSSTSQLGVLLAPAGMLLLVVIVMQLARGVIRVRVVESMSDIALLGVAVLALAALVQLRHALAGDVQAATVALVLGVAVAVSHLVDLVAPVPRFDPDVDRGLLATLVGAAAGAAVGYSQLRDVFGYGSLRGAFLGGALGIVVGLLAVGAAFAAHRGWAADDAPVAPARSTARLRPVATTLWCLAVATPVGYLLTLALGG